MYLKGRADSWPSNLWSSTQEQGSHASFRQLTLLARPRPVATLEVLSLPRKLLPSTLVLGFPLRSARNALSLSLGRFHS